MKNHFLGAPTVLNLSQSLVLASTTTWYNMKLILIVFALFGLDFFVFFFSHLRHYAMTIRTKNNIKEATSNASFQQAGVGQSPSAIRSWHVQVIIPSGNRSGVREMQRRPWASPLPLVPVFLLG